MVKKCKCGNCGEHFEGSTTRKIKKEATEHWIATGHRHFRKIRGWGDCTFPKLDREDAEEADAEEVVDEVPVEPWEEFGQDETPASLSQLIELLEDYVTRSKLKREVTDLRSELSELKTRVARRGANPQGTNGSADDEDVEELKEEMERLGSKINSLDQRTQGLDDRIERTVKSIVDSQLGSIESDIEKLLTRTEDLRGGLQMVYDDQMVEQIKELDGSDCAVPDCDKRAQRIVPMYRCKGGKPVIEREIGYCMGHGERTDAALMLKKEDASALRRLASEWFDRFKEDNFELYGERNMKSRFYEYFNKQAEKANHPRRLDPVENLA